PRRTHFRAEASDHLTERYRPVRHRLTTAGSTVYRKAPGVFLELGYDVGSQQLDGGHDRVVGKITELHVAENGIATDALVTLDLVGALVDLADDDHVLFGEMPGVEGPVAGGLEEGEAFHDRLVRHGRELPLDDELEHARIPVCHRRPHVIV